MTMSKTSPKYTPQGVEALVQPLLQAHTPLTVLAGNQGKPRPGDRTFITYNVISDSPVTFRTAHEVGKLEQARVTQVSVQAFGPEGLEGLRSLLLRLDGPGALIQASKTDLAYIGADGGITRLFSAVGAAGREQVAATTLRFGYTLEETFEPGQIPESTYVSHVEAEGEASPDDPFIISESQIPPTP